MALKFSIVTACLNRRSLIGDSIDSVLAQNYPEVEHIIVDGGSTDGTLDLLNRYPHLQVVSEPDRNLFEAWNKGIALATGDVIGILNSDDFYADEVFVAVAAILSETPEIEIVTGGARQFSENDDGSWTVIHDYTESPGPQIDLKRLSVWAPIINARFIRTTLHQQLGTFDVHYDLGSDADFCLRLALVQPRAAYLERCIYYYRTHPGSLSMDKNQRYFLNGLDGTLKVAEDHLASGRLSNQNRKYLSWRHSQRATTGVLSCFVQGQFGAALAFFRRGLRWNKAMPLALIEEAFRILRYKLRKPFRSGPLIIHDPPISHLRTGADRALTQTTTANC